MISTKFQSLSQNNTMLNWTKMLRATPLLFGLMLSLDENPAQAEVPIRPANPLHYQIAVNSNQDGPITPDLVLTLREAIALTNGDIIFEMLSDAERLQVQVLPAEQGSMIGSDLPPSSTTIYLQSLLPPLRQAGLRLNGLSFDGSSRVTLAPAESVELPIGLLAMADDITIQGFNFQGFYSDRATIYADHPFVGGVVVSTGQMLYDLGRLADVVQLSPPKNVAIAMNQFGEAATAETASTFGVVLFEAEQATIAGNQFFHQNSSAILTGKIATDFKIYDNVFTENGANGLGHAIHLGGDIDRGHVMQNRFCRNHGAGVFMFKPQGAIAVENNLFYGNGFPPEDSQISAASTQTKVAAVYLMNSQHQVINNLIMNQNGAGVVVAAYPRSEGNRIQDNLFGELQGLSIDLVARESTGIYDYRSGDGPNPSRDSHNRKLDTANGGVNAPRFAGLEFFPFGDRVLISGTADPGVTVDLYQVLESEGYFGPLNRFMLQTIADEEGHFEIYLNDWQLGDRLSAIATDPHFGTSEPAENAVIRSLNGPASMVLQENNNLSTDPHFGTSEPAENAVIRSLNSPASMVLQENNNLSIVIPRQCGLASQ
ncbi:MAG: right-handed parallel beta-helix repeat-containing protein [Limnothrix sp.]